jgi:hypothetical protein
MNLKKTATAAAAVAAAEAIAAAQIQVEAALASLAAADNKVVRCADDLQYPKERERLNRKKISSRSNMA